MPLAHCGWANFGSQRLGQYNRCFVIPSGGCAAAVAEESAVPQYQQSPAPPLFEKAAKSGGETAVPSTALARGQRSLLRAKPLRRDAPVPSGQSAAKSSCPQSTDPAAFFTQHFSLMPRHVPPKHCVDHRRPWGSGPRMSSVPRVSAIATRGFFSRIGSPTACSIV